MYLKLQQLLLGTFLLQLKYSQVFWKKKSWKFFSDSQHLVSLCLLMTLDKVCGLSVLLSRFSEFYFIYPQFPWVLYLKILCFSLFLVDQRTFLCQVLGSLMKLQSVSFPYTRKAFSTQRSMSFCLCWSKCCWQLLQLVRRLNLLLEFWTQSRPRGLAEAFNDLIPGNQFSLFLSLSLMKHNCVFLS